MISLPLESTKQDENTKTKLDKNLKQKSSSLLSNVHPEKRSKLQSSLVCDEIKAEMLSQDGDNNEMTLDIDDNGNAGENETEGTWHVFRDDFMMGAKMKDWDKEDSDADG